MNDYHSSSFSLYRKVTIMQTSVGQFLVEYSRLNRSPQLPLSCLRKSLSYKNHSPNGVLFSFENTCGLSRYRGGGHNEFNNPPDKDYPLTQSCIIKPLCNFSLYHTDDNSLSSCLEFYKVCHCINYSGIKQSTEEELKIEYIKRRIRKGLRHG